MKRSGSVVLGAVAVVGIGLCAYGLMTDETSLEDVEHTQICVDPETQERVQDDECDNGGSSGGRWFYGSSPRQRLSPRFPGEDSGGTAGAVHNFT